MIVSHDTRTGSVEVTVHFPDGFLRTHADVAHQSKYVRVTGCDAGHDGGVRVHFRYDPDGVSS
jgi:hypothetical protein